MRPLRRSEPLGSSVARCAPVTRSSDGQRRGSPGLRAPGWEFSGGGGQLRPRPSSRLVGAQACGDAQFGEEAEKSGAHSRDRSKRLLRLARTDSVTEWP